jgi:hypothetical protein
MKKSEILVQLSKTKINGNSAHALRVGDIVTHNKADHLVWLVNDSRASLVPMGNLNADPENISPESELPLVKRLGVPGAIALLESKTAPARTPKDKSKDEPRLGKLGGYLGHTVVSVIRTLGKAGFVFADTRAAFDRLGIAAADQTLRIQLKVGRDGLGSMADLSVAQLATFKTPKAAKAPKVAKLPKTPKAPKADLVAPALALAA